MHKLLSLRVKRFAFLCVGLMGLVVFGCDIVQQVLANAIPWPRWTVASDLSGADGVRLGDIDGDGLLDAVVAWEESERVAIYRNPGPGAARSAWSRVIIGSPPSPEDAVPVDLDQDGALDIVSCSEDGRLIQVHWAPSDAARRFNADAWVTREMPAADDRMQWMFCTPAQLDGVNGPDLIVGGKGDGARIGWLQAPADARDMSAWTWRPIRNADWVMALLAADIDNDGDVDIVASDRRGADRGCFWFENPGAQLVVDGPWTEHVIGGTDQNVMFMDLGDSNGDGLLDAAAATESRRVLVFIRADDPTIWTEFELALPDQAGTGKAVRIADMDYDGAVDLVFTCENAGGDRAGVGWLPAARILAGEAAAARLISGPAGEKFDLAELLDLDGDGDLDILTTEEGDGLGVVWYANPLQ